MKAFTPIAASLALALAPVAHAQVACSEVASLNSYGLEDFDEIADGEIEDDYYKASFSLSGASECTIDYSFDSIYSCVWTFPSQSAAASAFNSQVNAVSSCLAGWQHRTESPSGTVSNGFRQLQASYYEGSGSYIDMEWGVFLEEHTFDGGADWHVTVGLAYLW
jgi:hypothetical protein